ncbi:MAG: superoxide dismutase family protein [Rhizobiaceae bacterium]|nr:superoxide dismutase family protein [Rhizobiaceae bacterium]
MFRIVVAGAVGALAAGSATAEGGSASAAFFDAAGKDAGTATLSQTASGVLIDLDLSGLPAGGWVAFHVHETGNCDHTTGHDSAGGHFNPTGAAHGYLSADGPHAGDMPNQMVAADGTLKAQVFNPMVRLDGGDTAIRGRALMIHAGPDDYESQPSGKAGKRHACGVIE